MGKKLGASCSLNSECSRNGLSSFSCVSGRCTESTSDFKKLSTKTQKGFCSRYLTGIQNFKRCVQRECKSNDAQSRNLFDKAVPCPQVKCKKDIENVKSAAFDEFGLNLTVQGEVVPTLKFETADIM